MLKPEVIGDPECPLLHRWTFLGERLTRNWPVKIMLHHFMPWSSDRDPHDHPRGFLTIVLKGYYDDLKVCPTCMGEGKAWVMPIVFSWGSNNPVDAEAFKRCPECKGRKVVINETMEAGMIRWRPAEHMHQTQTGQPGAWTIVIMGPKVRDWGFFVHKKWIPFSQYKKTHKHGMRCE